MKNPKENSKPNFLQVDGLNPAVFNINGQTREFNIFELVEFYEFLKDHLITCSHLINTLNFYSNFEETLDERLDEMEKDFKERNNSREYCVGNNFAKFINTTHKIPKSKVKMSDNHKACKIVKRDYEEQFGKKHTLTFDAEMSYCYIYTKNREEAKQFELFAYNKYIKPVLESWYTGWDQFVKLWKSAPQNLKDKLITLQY